MLYMCVMDIMNVLPTGMNMSFSHIHVWLCNSASLDNVESTFSKNYAKRGLD